MQIFLSLLLGGVKGWVVFRPQAGVAIGGEHMHKDSVLNETQLDFFEEMMNIGGGNAASVLSQLLGCRVEVNIPEIQELVITDLSAIPNFASPVLCIKMHMLGDATGDLLFVITAGQKAFLINVIEKNLSPLIKAKAKNKDASEWDRTVIEEIGNILASAYLRAISSFCKLNIYHSTPTLKSALLLTLLDRSVKESGSKGRLLLIRTDFRVMETPIDACFIMTISSEFIKRLAIAMDEAIKIMEEGKG